MVPSERVSLRSIVTVAVLVALVSVVTPMATPGSAQSTATDTATQNATGSNGSVTYPAGYSASGVSDPARAADQHVMALYERNSFTFVLNRTTRTETTQTSIRLVQRANNTAERSYTNATAESGTSGAATLTAEQYYNGSTGYSRTVIPLVSNGTQYNVTEQPFGVTYNATATAFQQFLGNASYGSPETVERNGETLLRYEATELTDAGAFLGGQFIDVTAENVTAFNVTVLVDRSGVIRSFSYSANYTSMEGNATRTTEVRITDLNTTVVEEPDWLDEAKANVSARNATDEGSDVGAVATTATPTATTTPTETATSTTTETDTPTATEITTSTPTETATPTPTTTDAATTTDTATPTGTDSSAPFGLLAAVVALLAVAFLAVRRG